MNSAASVPPAVVVITDLVVFCRHLDLIKEIESRGLRPLFVFGPETPADRLALHRGDPGHPLSRVAEAVHVADCELDTLLAGVRTYLTDYDVQAVLNCGEAFVEPAGALAETLGLPGPGAHAARVCRHKVLQRLAAPHLAPHWAMLGRTGQASAAAYDWEVFPAVLKPAGRMSSSGVRSVADTAELWNELADYPPDEMLLLEERVRGAEFSVESLVHEGEILWSGITAKNTNEAGTRYFTETGHTSPAPGLTPAEETRLLEANASLLRALSFRTGMSHAEFRLSGERVALMEIAARPPGDAITKLWHLATGRPLEPALVDLALGVRPDVPTARRRARQIYLDHPVGVLSDVVCTEDVPVSWVSTDGAWPHFAPVEPDAPARLAAVIVTREAGQELGEWRDSGGRAVSVIADGPLDEDLHAAAERLARAVHITTAVRGDAPLR
ncbi:ATP-grasp domain-containing protein [Streptomyces aureoverticillatus]|uniref:ATP-grasp domain-containing protein n=1 Tax=Streptomyces aureoverticillatus TaxID=66871 RepID=UPI0013DC3CD2|nr:ATP-grasp domain-containing protein [Streptomyces aureoverticillatus]QIB42672.1 ATP-grasp domain-containing protein [Streptomyces aureoverticillatus]